MNLSTFKSRSKKRSSTTSRFHYLVFATATTLSAFLLFQIQPLLAKFILPWFGGATAVWTTCMLFFQFVLLGGYTYAHWLIQRFPPSKQALVHIALLTIAIAMLPVVPDSNWKPRPDAEPSFHILALLTVVVGLPYFALSATGPLLQAWFGRVAADRSPYPLYSISNLGSLLALTTFPFLFEPAFSRQGIALGWSAGFVIFSVLCVLCALRFRRATEQATPPAPGPVTNQKPPEHSAIRPTFAWRRHEAFWFILPACSSVLLLATTNKACQDVASIPFLWILPLVIYLASFIACFATRSWYWRWTYHLLFLAVPPHLWLLARAGPDLALWVQLAVYFGSLLVVCMVCHGEVYRLRPPPEFLTSYYLCLSAGGAAGGVMVAIVAPAILQTYAELPFGVGTMAVALCLLHLQEKPTIHCGRLFSLSTWHLMICGGAAAVLFLSKAQDPVRGHLVATARNFYGIVRIEEVDADDANRRAFGMRHGAILHGFQFKSPSRSSMPTAYYGNESGAGLTLSQALRKGPCRIGVIGLGIGTLATYGRLGDSFWFFEINPDVKRLAETHFSFLRESKANIQVVLGDGRLRLDTEKPMELDVLVLDAFSSDAVPVHLLTVEAFELYLRHVKPSGAVVANITNTHLDLMPVARALASRLGLAYAHLPNAPIVVQAGQYESHFVVFSKDPDFVRSVSNRVATPWAISTSTNSILWTDEYASLFPLLK